MNAEITETTHLMRKHRGKASKVLLVSMPFAPLLMPSIGLSLLKAAMIPTGISTRILYFSIKFAERIGPKIYSTLAAGAPANHDLLGEWVFSDSLFSQQSEADIERYIQEVLYGQSPGHAKVSTKLETITKNFIDEVFKARNQVKSFLDDCLEIVIESQASIVGFTSVFQQQVASLSLAKRIKAHAPEMFIVFGGANCEGVMGAEIIHQFQFVDAVVSGEGDLIFPELVERLEDGRSITDLPGVFHRAHSPFHIVDKPLRNTPPIKNMDALPFPHYEDYFEQLGESGLDLPLPPRLLFETSRGCWWGEKHHCTFCGLNGETMTYRSKSAERAMDELVYLAEKYPGHPISVVDNILDMRYFKDFIPALVARQLDLELFYEVKANLTKDQVRLLHDARITSIQPGIESLSDSVLKLMRKGVKGLQNVQLLKWCKELAVNPEWNILWGFPGEQPEDYYHMAEMIPLLTHLPPPGSASPLRLDRFSPNFNMSEEFGLKNVSPYPAYNFVYPLAPEVLSNLAYYFTFDYHKPQDVMSYVKPLVREITVWQQCHQSSDLFFMDKGTHLLIWDFRPIALKPLAVLVGLNKYLYLACDQIRSNSQLYHMADSYFGARQDEKSINDALQAFLSNGLMVKEEDSYLSLAIPMEDYSPNAAIMKRLLETVEALSASTDTEGEMYIDCNQFII